MELLTLRLFAFLYTMGIVCIQLPTPVLCIFDVIPHALTANEIQRIIQA